MANNLFYIPLINFSHRLSKEYDLGEGFSLVKFPREFDVDYRTFGHAYFKRHYGDRFLSEAKDTYCLRYHWPGKTFKSTREMIYHIEDPAITFLIALRLIKPCPVGFKMMFHTPALSKEFPFDFSEYQMIGFRGGSSQVIQKFVEEEIWEAKTLFLKLMGLLKNEYRYRRIFNTLRYFDLGYRSPNVDSRVIFFMIALEVLYKPSQGKITRVIAQRLSDFLGKNREEKKTLVEKGYEMMNFKARLTHGDMTYFDISRPERIQIVVEEEEILRRTLQKILRDDELIETFSSLSKREVFFNTLLPQSVYSKSSRTQNKGK